MTESRELATANTGSTIAGEHFLACLKADTQARHIALENTRLTRELMSPELTRARYGTILYGFYGAFAPLEEALVTTLPAAPLEPIHRTPLAEADIRHVLGQFDASRLQVGIALPWLSLDVPIMLGITYVLEGSRLGGKAISRHIQQTIGITAEEGGSFFAGTDSPGLSGWKAFKKYCADYASHHPDQQTKIIQAANDTFRYVEEYFAALYPTTDC
jgi:heme oxygenase (biliverdin-IX-beta and delta-forming)